MKKTGKRQRVASHVNNVLVASNPQIAAIKHVLNTMGYRAGVPRKPLLPLGEASKMSVDRALSGTKLY
jgi:dihydrodipicolinate synthase/N-acetylneuraminate lyase